MSILKLEPKYGYYSIHYGNEQIITVSSKLEAIEAAQRTNGWIQYHFNDDVYSCYDWREPIVESISDLYAQRARDIRQQYERVVCCYSGGFDSHNMLQSFLSNKIPVDAVLCFYNSLAEGTEDTIGEEWLLQTKPRLEPILAQHPEIDFFRIDISYKSLELVDKYRDDYLHVSNGILSPNSISISHLIEFLPAKYQDCNTVLLFGVDKPRLRFKDGKFILNFLDVGLRARPVIAESRIEYFYWNRTVPKLLIKQAQLARDYWRSRIEADPSLVKSRWNPNLGCVFDHDDVGLNRAIYPHCQIGMFLTWRPNPFNKWGKILGERDKWLYQSNLPQAALLKDIYQGLTDNVSKQWFNNNDHRQGYVGNISQDYIL